MRHLTLTLLAVASTCCIANDEAPIKKAIVFHATFDKSPDADFAKGDNKIHTAETLERKVSRPGLPGEAVKWLSTGGRQGGALKFEKQTKQLVYFKGGANLPYDSKNFQGTVSLWLRLSPAEDLPKGFVDPLQITDKKWNDASFFVDFDQDLSRDFRLGVFSDYKFWNPDDRKFDDIPAEQRPMVFVKQPPFVRDQWTHVAFTWSGVNSAKTAIANLYLNGKVQGAIAGKQRFTWEAEKAVIMLGINYVGWMDDLTIFNRALDQREIQSLRN